MRKIGKTIFRTLYLLPALGVLFGGSVSKDEGGITTLFNPEKASADIPYAQGAYQDYYQSSYSDAGDYYYQWQGDCPAPGPGPDSPSPSPSPDACC